MLLYKQRSSRSSKKLIHHQHHLQVHLHLKEAHRVLQQGYKYKTLLEAVEVR
jgi:hypothetical protein